MATETLPLEEAADASNNGSNNVPPAPIVIAEPDERETVPRFGDPRDAVVTIVRDRLERMLQPVDDPDPVQWLSDADYDRLYWAIARARGHAGGSTSEDEADARAILAELESIRLASDRPLWAGVNVITTKDLDAATAEPLPPASIFAASVRTPAYIYVDAVCPVCNIAGSITLEIDAKLTATKGSRKLQLAAKATALPHVCGQKRLELGGPTPPAKGQVAAFDADDSDDGEVLDDPDVPDDPVREEYSEIAESIAADDEVDDAERDAIHTLAAVKPAKDEPDDLSDLPF